MVYVFSSNYLGSQLSRLIFSTFLKPAFFGGMIALTLLFGAFSYASEQPFIVSKPPPEVPGDARNDWNTKLITLALEETLEDYGPYEIRETPNMNRARIWKSIVNNRYPNLVMPTAYSSEHLRGNQIDFIPFPVELGLIGYRVCFYPKSKADKISEKLKNGQHRELKYGMHSEWEDAEILRHNGFLVKPIMSYDSLFKMTAAGRFDLFCRSISEIYDEYNNYKDLDGLAIEQTTVFHYPLPIFFWINTQNTLAKERLYTGFLRAFENGKLLVLFTNHYNEKIAFTNFEDRNIIELENPLLDKLDSAYEQFNFLPSANIHGSHRIQKH